MPPPQSRQRRRVLNTRKSANDQPKVNNPLGLSLDLGQLGLVGKQHAFQMMEEITDHLLDEVQLWIQRKQVNFKYKPYCVIGVLQEAEAMMKYMDLNSDDREPKYEYLDECAEPEAAPIDPFGKTPVVQALFAQTVSMLDVTQKHRKKRKKTSTMNLSPKSDLSESSATRRYKGMPKLQLDRKRFLMKELSSTSRGNHLRHPNLSNQDLSEHSNPHKIYRIPDDPEHKEQQQERAAMQEKLDTFRRFKKSSHALVKKQREMYPVKKFKEKTENMMTMLGISSDDDSIEGNIGLNKNKVDFLRKARIQKQKDNNKKVKVTFDFKGKVLKMKNPKISDNVDQIAVLPEVRVSQGKRTRVRSMKPQNEDYNQKETIVGQFGDELDRIYEERELKLQMANKSGSDNSIEMVDMAAKETQNSQLQRGNTLSKDGFYSYSKKRTMRLKRGDKKDKMNDTLASDNTDKQQESYLKGAGKKKGDTLLLATKTVDNLLEMGHAHVKHMDRLFMKDPMEQVDQSSITSGIKFKAKKSGLEFGGTPFKSNQDLMSLHQYQQMKQQQDGFDDQATSQENIAIMQSNFKHQITGKESTLSAIMKPTERSYSQMDSPKVFMTKDKSANVLGEVHQTISPLDIYGERADSVKLTEIHEPIKASSIRSIVRSKKSSFAMTNKISFAKDPQIMDQAHTSRFHMRNTSMPQISGAVPRSLSMLMQLEDSDQPEMGKLNYRTQNTSQFLPEVPLQGVGDRQSKDLTGYQAWLNSSGRKPSKVGYGLTSRDKITGALKPTPLQQFVQESNTLVPNSTKSLKLKTIQRPRQQAKKLFATMNASAAKISEAGDTSILWNNNVNNNYGTLSTITPIRKLQHNRSSLLHESLNDDLNQTKQSAKLSFQLMDRLKEHRALNKVRVTENAVEILRKASNQNWTPERPTRQTNE